MITNARPVADEEKFIARPNAKLRRALVIEGDPLVARSLALMLGAKAFVVKTTSLGADGVRLAKSAAYELILLGVDLPDMSGLEAMSQLRSADFKGVMVFASVTRATAESTATLHLSDGS